MCEHAAIGDRAGPAHGPGHAALGVGGRPGRGVERS